jgi:ParB-like chromosome segregation protein Spo0J
MRPKNRLKEKLRPYPDDYLEIADIRIGRRHRKDHGDLQLLADSIALVGLLQPIGISEDRELVFGERRLLACRDILGWSEIPARTVDVRSIVEGEFHENEVRKDFTPSERVAIERTINAELERRQGARADLGQNLARSEDHRTSKESARLAGFGNRETARQARKVVERGTPELVDAMDRGEIAICAAADLAGEPQEEQRKRLDLPSKKEALKQAKATGAAVLARDGKYYAHVEPEREAQTERWLSFKDVPWNVADQKVDPAEIIQSVPPYQHAEFGRRLRLAREFLDRLAIEWREKLNNSPRDEAAAGRLF